jgi:hypothetical protein
MHINSKESRPKISTYQATVPSKVSLIKNCIYTHSLCTFLPSAFTSTFCVYNALRHSLVIIKQYKKYFNIFHGIRALGKRHISKFSLSCFFFQSLMASSDIPASSSPSPTISLVLPNYTQMSGVKLEGPNNYLKWLSIFLPVLRSNELLGIIDGTEPVPQSI